jgi:uncharacterized protein (TIGR00369 family)
MPKPPLHIPFLELLGAHAEEQGKGRAVVSLDLRPALANSWQVAHGGVVMTLLDVCMGLAARTTVVEGAGVMTVDVTVSFLRAGSGRLVAEGRALHSGRSLVFCEGEVRAAGGQLVAKALGTFKLRRARDGAPAGLTGETA